MIFSVFGRLKPGASLERAQSEMDGIAARIREEDQISETAGYHVRITPMQQDITKHVRALVLALLGSVGFVLLIACANVSNLLVAQGARRSRELAVRAALGGSRFRVARQLMVEVALLCLAGGGLALLGAWAVLGRFTSLLPHDLPRAADVAISPAVVFFTLGCSLVAAILTGTLPTLRSGARGLTRLAGSGRGASAGRDEARSDGGGESGDGDGLESESGGSEQASTPATLQQGLVDTFA